MCRAGLEILLAAVPDDPEDGPLGQQFELRLSELETADERIQTSSHLEPMHPGVVTAWLEPGSPAREREPENGFAHFSPFQKRPSLNPHTSFKPKFDNI